MADEFACDVLSDRHLLLRLTTSGHTAVMQIDAKDAALMAAKILVAAKSAFISSGKVLPDPAKHRTEWTATHPTSIGLAPARKPDHETLMVEFGEARLGFEFEASKLQILGTALLALAAPKGPAN